MRVAVIDYGAGNLRSVETALRHLAADFVITEDPSEVERADRLLIPGVGDAGAAMKRLEAAGLADAIRSFHRMEKPILGICLGSQIVLDGSEERGARCLGLIPGRAKRIPLAPGLKVPHMGWNTIRQTTDSALLTGVPDDASFYFVHSYYPAPDDPADTLTTTEYGVQFASGIARGNLVAFQFHPEKSGRHGLRILTNFLKRS